MMVAIRAKFDGKVFVPDGPVNMPVGRDVVLHVEAPPIAPPVRPMTGAEMVDLIRSLKFDPADVDEMAKVIEEECERVDHDE